MKALRIFNGVAVASSAAVICWLVSDIYGSIFKYFFYRLPFILLYIVSFFETFTSLISSGYKKNKLKLACHAVVILTIITYNTTQAFSLPG